MPFRDGPINDVVIRELKPWEDQRGWLIELFRHDEMDAEYHPVMGYISETLPGVARGPHEHVDQSDYFAFIGPGDLTLYLWDSREDSATFGNRIKQPVGQSNKVGIIIPPGVVHAYKNTSDVPAWVVNLPNRLYAGEGKNEPVDEIRHEDKVDSEYVME